MSRSSQVALVTGASSGFGKVIAERLGRTGITVYGTSRSRRADEPAYRMIPMDVGDETSVREAVATVVDRESRIDILVNNAGMGIAGAVEDTTISEAQRQFDTNFFGAVRVIQVVLPHMRGQGSGSIINIGSIAGQIGTPFQGFYSASKFALEGLTEALRLELRPFGIDVVVIEPGDFKTGFTDSRVVAEAASDGAYAEQFNKTLDVYVRDEISGADPELLADLVERVLRSRSPKVRYLVGMFGQKAAVMLKRMTGSRTFEAVMRKHCRIE